MQLIGYSDSESQALHLNPFMSARPVIGPGDEETQPLWLTSPILPIIPDACHPLEVGQQVPWWLNFDEDVEQILQLLRQGACDVEIGVLGSKQLEIGIPGQVEIDVETSTDAEAMLRLKEQAGVAVEISVNAEEPLQVGQEAGQQLWLEDESSIDLRVREDGYMELNVELCDE